MTEQPIRFDDADAYERAMGVWSQIAGDAFLGWLAPASGLRWLDIGCGNGAFTELLSRRCAPSAIDAIDPSEAQLAYARARPGLASADFQIGDAMALPFEAASFGAAVMALVVFFVPDPARGVSEMVRVVRPGGLVSAYAWDFSVGGFPFEPVYVGLRAVGRTPTLPPQAGVAQSGPLRALWAGAGLERIEARVIEVERVFADFEDYWDASTGMSMMRAVFEAMDSAERDAVRAEARARVTTDASGKVRFEAKANAIKGWNRASV